MRGALSSRLFGSVACHDDLQAVEQKEEYYILEGDDTKGPYSIDDLRSRWKSGAITPMTYFCQVGYKEWLRLSELALELNRMEQVTDEAPQTTLDSSETHHLRKLLVKFIFDLLKLPNSQPSAGELLLKVEEKLGWHVRHEILPVIRQLRDYKRLPHYQRRYLQTTLGDEEIAEALRGEARRTHEDHATLDELFHRSATHRGSKAFREMIEFTARFTAYKPFNNLLVKLQNPSCCYYATEKHWRVHLFRKIKMDAKPMLILAPMHPVLLVYDLDSTEADPDCPEKAVLPEDLVKFRQVDGQFCADALPTLVENAERDRIMVEFKQLSSTHGGRATSRTESSDWKMRTIIHNELDSRSRFTVLCHELAHIYLGHLGGDRDGWWPCRINLNHSTVEIEAEATAYIISIRLGLRPCSEEYLASFLKSETVPESVSIEMIVKVAGKLEEMSKKVLPKRKSRNV